MAPITMLQQNSSAKLEKKHIMMTGTNVCGHTHVILGTNCVANTRSETSMAAGAIPIIVADENATLHQGLRRKIDQGLIHWTKKIFDDNDLFTLGREEVAHIVDAVFLTGPGPNIERIAQICKRNRIPINVVGAPRLSTFTLLSTYTDGPLQVGVTTNTNNANCELSSRIVREIASKLPRNLGTACMLLDQAMEQLQHKNQEPPPSPPPEDDDLTQSFTFGNLTKRNQTQEDDRKAEWLAQVCEYWPLKAISSLTKLDIGKILSEEKHLKRPNSLPSKTPTKIGRIILAGTGPGHPDLVTRATLKAMKTADLVLADKLVPVEILDLIPSNVPIQIARKFPGNAEAAQQELQDACIAAAQAGKCVLRLKQGDPFVYGRGGEEVECFRKAGLGDRVSVLPGITSALCAPLLAGIPTTQRGVADQVLVCTGMGRKGNVPSPPDFCPSRTTIFLMALHRIHDLVRQLTVREGKVDSRPGSESETSSRTPWPCDTPCAVIERASCPDQRVIRSTLQHVAEAVETEGSRPPGLLVVGATCNSLCGRDENSKWSVEEGSGGLTRNNKVI